jgi:MFS family permease
VTGPGTFFGDLGIVLRGGDFRRLFAVRLVSQFADGALQVALAAFVFFSPERQTTAPAAAAAFATLLLPFSVVGPFAGVLLDRWSRRQILLWSNVVRTLLVCSLALLVASDVHGPAFFAVALVTLSVNRFFLACLGASLPHVVPAHELVMANAVSPTCGTLAALAGAGAGFGVRELTGADGAVLGWAAVLYAVAALLALRLAYGLLGPDHAVEAHLRHALADVARGLAGGARHVVLHRPAARALAVIAANRFGYGIETIALILLFRNTFADPGDADAGLAGLGMAFGVSGLGFFVAAVATPIAVRRLGRDGHGTEHWMVVLLLVVAAMQVPIAAYTVPAVLLAAFVIGFAAQGLKICVDTVVQRSIDDEFRGRVFAIYDVLFNATFVAAATVAAMVLPPSGRSYVVLLSLGLLSLVTATLLRRDVARERTRAAAVAVPPPVPVP